MAESISPLVSCVMPTRGRHDMVAAALDCWQRQTYRNKELVILDDADCPSFPDGVDLDGVNYHVTGERVTLGEKRNKVNALASGEIICHWDSDDWSAADRIQYQVDLLIKSGKPVTGLSNLLFWDPAQQQQRLYKAQVRGYVVGTSLCYLQTFWKQQPFVHKQVASDNSFVYPILSQIAASSEIRFMVARVHTDHTSKNKTNIGQAVVDRIPPAFWENEQLRLSGGLND